MKRGARDRDHDGGRALAAVGGGSLVYGNTLYYPNDKFFNAWWYITDWKAETAPYFDQCQRMFGVGSRGCEARNGL